VLDLRAFESNHLKPNRQTDPGWYTQDVLDEYERLRKNAHVAQQDLDDVEGEEKPFGDPIEVEDTGGGYRWSAWDLEDFRNDETFDSWTNP